MYYNRLIWMQPNGQYGYYDKRHLFRYAGEDVEFSSGTRRFIARVNGLRICCLICYDLRFPVWSRLREANEYDVLLLVANWPAKRRLAWETLLQARAIENQCYVIGVNRTGQDANGLVYPGGSRLIDPLGKILLDAGEQPNILSARIDKNRVDDVRRQLPFQQDKDAFVLFDDVHPSALETETNDDDA